MKGFSKIALAAVIGVVGAGVAVRAEQAKAGGTMSPMSMASKPVMMTPDQLKWAPNPGNPAVKTAVLWGDMDKGPHGALHKFTEGLTVPLHTHSADQRLVVISGTMSMAGADGKEMKFPAGSYYTQPHTYAHVTKCLPGSDCVVLVVSNGKFDIKMAEDKK